MVLEWWFSVKLCETAASVQVSFSGIFENVLFVKIGFESVSEAQPLCKAIWVTVQNIESDAKGVTSLIILWKYNCSQLKGVPLADFSAEIFTSLSFVLSSDISIFFCVYRLKAFPCVCMWWKKNTWIDRLASSKIAFLWAFPKTMKLNIIFVIR